MGRMIPVDIVVLAVFIWLGFKLVRWWSRARSLEAKNAQLLAENEQLKSDIGVLADNHDREPRKR